MAEQHCTVGDVELCFETFGDPGRPAMLLVMGLATQMVAWHDDFCRALVDRGFHVIRFDNRDVGRSSTIKGQRPPTLFQLMRRRIPPGYTLDDMADDAAGLLDHLDVGAAHVVGASMGGMIAQTLAARDSDRVRSLVSIMSTTGSRRAGRPKLRAYPALFRPAPAEREQFVEYMVRMFGLIGSPGFERDEAWLREVAGTSFDRGRNPAGVLRQLGAIVASGDRTPALGAIRVPTLVIHGDRDRLVPLSGGRATAAAIPGAELLVIPGMGHDLPRGAWPQVLDAIEANAAKASDPAVAA